MFDVCLLGTGGMMPLPKRFLTSALLRYNGNMILIDCGEATQISLKMLGWGFKNINTICFTHFHADHISGLPGMLLTLSNSGRVEPLTIIGPKGVEKIVNCLRAIAPDLTFDLKFIEVNSSNVNDEIVVDDFIIKTCEMKHGIPCLSYSINVKRAGKFNLEEAERLEIPKKYWSILQRGEAVDKYTPDMVMGEERKGFKVSYCTDSRPTDELPEFIKGSDLFICEGMYGDEEEKPKAIERKHMMFSEAAEMAKKGEVDKMWLTHFSPSLTNPADFLEVATNIFENTECGTDRKVITLKYED